MEWSRANPLLLSFLLLLDLIRAEKGEIYAMEPTEKIPTKFPSSRFLLSAALCSTGHLFNVFLTVMAYLALPIDRPGQGGRRQRWPYILQRRSTTFRDTSHIEKCRFLSISFSGDGSLPGVRRQLVSWRRRGVGGATPGGVPGIPRLGELSLTARIAGNQRGAKPRSSPDDRA